ncbi:MAG: cadherin-like beta sandwich domain-containing protein [Clostridium sp.]
MKVKKFFIGLVSVSLCSSPMLVRAAIAPGGSFNASASCGNYEGAVTASGSNATVTSSSNWCDRGGTVTATAQAGGAGSASVSFTVIDATDVSDPLNPKLVGNVGIGGTTVTVAEPTKPKPSVPNNNTSNTPANTQTPKPEVEPKEDSRSKDNTLKSLSVSEGTLSPKFSKDTTSYKVDLPADASSITVKATANDSKANVSGAGKIKLSAGNNEVNIVVTSEYGTKKTYTINVYVDEKPLIYTEYNGKKLGVVRNVNGVKAPDNFKKTTTKLDGKEITAWTNEKMKKTIVYLSDEKNNKNFYLFEDGKVTSKFEYVEILGRHFYLIDIPKDKQEMVGLKYGELTIDKIKLMGWTFEDKAFENYQIFMAMDMSGETRYYQYEKSENTIQLYSGAATVTQESFQKQSDKLKDAQQQRTIWMAVAIVSLIGLACIGGAYFWKKQNKEK